MNAIEALLAHLPESSATIRDKRDVIVDMNGVLLAQIFDFMVQKNWGKKRVPHDKKMMNLLKKSEEKVVIPMEDMVKAAEYARAEFERKRKLRIASATHSDIAITEV